MTSRFHSLFLRATAFTLLASIAIAAKLTDADAATARARSAPVLTLYFENDIVTGTDEHYTNGLKASWQSADLIEWGQVGWRERFVECLPFVNRRDGQKNIGFALGQNIYTPRDITRVVPDPNDRPYAGWAYAEVAFVSKTRSVSDTIAIQVGLIGPHSLAEDAQRLAHRWTDNLEPHGWDYQLRDELGVNVVYERRWRLYARSLYQTVGIDLLPHVGVSLGNVQTYANAGGTLRVGLNLPSDFGVQLARPGSVGGTPTDDLDPRVALDRNLSVFLLGAADGRAVARDIFLDGNTFRASRSVNKEPFVADLTAGIGVIAGPWQLTYTQVWRTREFETQRGRYNRFGSVTLSRAY
jgi:lipid A 3-O-deacylase